MTSGCEKVIKLSSYKEHDLEEMEKVLVSVVSSCRHFRGMLLFFYASDHTAVQITALAPSPSQKKSFVSCQ